MSIVTVWVVIKLHCNAYRKMWSTVTYVAWSVCECVSIGHEGRVLGMHPDLPKQEVALRGNTQVCPDLPTVDILNLICNRVAVMWPVATSIIELVDDSKPHGLYLANHHSHLQPAWVKLTL